MASVHESVGQVGPPAEVIDRLEALRTAPLLRDFTEVGLRILAGASTQRSVGRGTFAFRAGEPSSALVFLAKGTLQLLAREGGAQLGEIGPGDTMGGFALFSGGEHLLSARAATDVELIVLTKPVFDELRKTRPGASMKLLLAIAADFAERMREAKAPLREFLAWQVSKRPEER